MRKTGVHVGPIHSAVAGRTDHLPMHVPSGAYVLPADIVSAMGEGNTAAGFKVKLDAPKVQLANVEETEYSGSLAFKFGATFSPNTGNDEFKITTA